MYGKGDVGYIRYKGPRNASLGTSLIRKDQGMFTKSEIRLRKVQVAVVVCTV